MKRKELTERFMMISNAKTLWSPWFLLKYFSTVSVERYTFLFLCWRLREECHQPQRLFFKCVNSFKRFASLERGWGGGGEEGGLM